MNLQTIKRDHYAHYVSRALSEVARAARATTEGTRSISLAFAYRDLRQALRWANAIGDRALRSFCLRVLNWLRADLRRAA
ncbi:hypothetical protein ASE63_22265 [Bosea sp. Root381]|uniref:hypothetical protein n=1 Tax=Bosea sp. Root381 TaxID=1736524 RepID=UPI0006FAEAA6|nr:hypothetical protein [Bosea sp. Root381]KRE07427.1 hypothetical protein ASE63_22265 [Bosea sp. Root381]